MLKQENTINVEQLRQRSKDNKAENGRFFLEQALSGLDKLRNVLFLASFAIVGYLGAIEEKSLETKSIQLILSSLSLGLVSYLFLYIFSIKKTEMYSQLEKNMSASTVLSADPYSQYGEMVNSEEPIYEKFRFIGIWHFLQVVTVVGQGILLIIFSAKILK